MLDMFDPLKLIKSGGVDITRRMWKIILWNGHKSFTFAHFKTEWPARRRKAGWES